MKDYVYFLDKTGYDGIIEYVINAWFCRSRPTDESFSVM